jgi:hypothetical protein
VFNASSNAIASLRQAQGGGPGMFILGDASGREAVRMTVNDNRYGAVVAGPTLGFPYVPASGVLGSYFFGCAGGDRCYGY